MLKFTCTLTQAFKKIFYVVMLLCFGMKAKAQNSKQQNDLEKDQRVEKVIFNKDLNTPSLIKVNPFSKVSLLQTPTVLKQLVNADENTEFKKLSSSLSSKEAKGGSNEELHTEKFQQYFKGIKVEHGILNALMRGDQAEAFTVEYYDLKAIKTVPTITEAKAIEFAKAYVNAAKYAWEQAKEARDVETDPLRKQLYNDAYEKLLPKGELVIVKDYSTKNVSDLAYKFDMYAGAPLSRGWIYVNAHTGKIMLYDKIIKHVSPDFDNTKQFDGIVPEVAFIMSGNADLTSPEAIGDTATVPIPTRYAGTRLMGVTQVSGTANDPSGNGMPIVNSINGAPFLPGQNPWTLVDKRFHGVGSNQNEQTYDLNGVGGLPISVPAYGQARSFTDLDNNWTLAEHKRGGNNEGENDDFGFDAHWGAGIVYQYWKNIHGRLSYDNKNSSIKSYIHSGVAYDNAFWNGSVMTYGDGSFQGGAQTGFGPLTALDVCGHEIGHGVCSNTSNLVYANESGGMNEGYSDVWAACVENYALLNIDPTLIASSTFMNGFEIWGIGEQIDARDATGAAPNLVDLPTFNPAHKALRYMDNPGKANNPSSYAERTNQFNGTAERWTEIPCTGGPTLANDQCGVHNNSGVLNHAFYYLVAGSGGPKFVNTRQAIVNAAHGVDAATDLAPYNVAGIGFAKAEKIFYLAELNITPNATFLQQRNAAVLAAEVLYGKCSFEWKQTILAYNGVAIGRSSDTAVCSNSPVFSAAIGRTSISETIGKSNVNCTDPIQIVEMSVSVLFPGITNPLTVTITPSGTATNIQDYILSATTINYAANETGLKKVTVSVYNDAEIESMETASFAIHAQDAFGFVKDTTLMLNIVDDDAVPVIGVGRTVLLNENFDGATGGALPTGWSTIEILTPSGISYFTGNPGVTGFGGNAAFVALKTAPTVPAYEATIGGEIILTTPNIDARGKSDIKLKFKYAAGGEPSGNGATDALDFGRVQYSFNGGLTYQDFSDSVRRYALTPNGKLDSITLPSMFNNRQFKLGFNWYNDGNVAFPPGFIIDSVEVSGGTQKVETQLNQGVAEKHFANKDIYYASANDGQILARVFNNSADLGCVNASVTEAGNGTGTNINYNGSTYQRAKRVVKITPSVVSSAITYNLTLYATTAELAGLTPSALHILKVKDGTPTTGTLASADVVELTPVFADFSSDGYYTYTVSNVTGFSQFVIAVNSGVLPQKLLSFNVAAQNNKFIKISWSTTNETNGRHTIERSVKGLNDFKTINEQAMLGNSGVNEYFYDDVNVNANVIYQYRLKSVENNIVSYSAIKQATITGKDNYIDIAPNPSNGMFKISLNGYSGMGNLIVYSATGQEVFQYKKSLENNTLVTIDLTKQPAGVYTLKINTDAGNEVYKLIVQ